MPSVDDRHSMNKVSAGGRDTEVVTLESARALGEPPPGNLAVPVFAQGSLEVELYSPRGVDRQQPHSRDEVYVVASGQGIFFDGEFRHVVNSGSFIYVRAGQVHRFEDFSSDFSVWVLFFGPEAD